MVLVWVYATGCCAIERSIEVGHLVRVHLLQASFSSLKSFAWILLQGHRLIGDSEALFLVSDPLGAAHGLWLCCGVKVCFLEVVLDILEP